MGRLGIALFGPMQVTHNARSISGFGYDKVRALLAYLALEPDRPHRREALAGLLWPEVPERVARDSLRTALATLRQAISDESADPPYLFITRESIQFNRASDHTLDTAEFSRRLDSVAGHRHRNATTCRYCAGWLREAADLYRGPLLAQFSLPDSAEFETWLLPRRAALQDEALAVFERLAAHFLQRGDHLAARFFAARQIALEPWREPAHRQAMTALAYAGNRAGALKQFELCRAALAEELDVAPEPETVFLYEQIRDGKLAAELAPRRVAPPPMPLIGREQELNGLGQKLADPDIRLVTLIGPGGVGKTSLASAAGHLFGADFGDGSVFIPLVTVEHSADLMPAIAGGLGLLLEPTRTAGEQVREYLHARELLVVLDNFEQLLDGASQLGELISAAPGVVFLVTSRQRLGLTNEWLVELGGLDYPAHDSSAPLAEFSAIQLFARRAQQERGDFALISAQAASAAEICRLVQGMPLAIELAAAATTVLPANVIADQLRNGLVALSAEWTDLPPRHRSIRAMLEQSWSLLSAEERHALRYLSVFRGGFDVAAANEVAGASAEALRRLRDKSLLQVQPTSGRFDLHPLIRAFAAERLLSRDEDGDAARRHLAYFTNVAELAEQGLKGHDQLDWLARLETDHANILAALSWAEQHDLEGAARIAAAMWLFWFMRGYLLEARRRYEWLYPQRAGLPLRRLAPLLNALTSAIMGQSDFGRIEPVAAEALTCYRALGDIEGIALAFHHLALAARAAGNLEEADRLGREGLAVTQAGADRKLAWVTTVLLDTQASTLRERGQLDEAEALIREGEAIGLEIGDRWGWSYKLVKRALQALERGQLDLARSKLEQTLSVASEFGDRRLLGFAFIHLGLLALREGNLAEAWQRLETAERYHQEVGDRLGRADAQELLGDILTQRGLTAEAAQHYREAHDLAAEAGDLVAAQKIASKLQDAAGTVG